MRNLYTVCEPGKSKYNRTSGAVCVVHPHPYTSGWNVLLYILLMAVIDLARDARRKTEQITKAKHNFD